jgi:hypothetical protein
MNLTLELRLAVYKQTRGKPCSRCKPNSVRSMCHSPEVDSHPGDRASRSIVKARGQDNIFNALESKQLPPPLPRPAVGRGGGGGGCHFSASAGLPARWCAVQHLL